MNTLQRERGVEEEQFKLKCLLLFRVINGVIIKKKYKILTQWVKIPAIFGNLSLISEVHVKIKERTDFTNFI